METTENKEKKDVKEQKVAEEYLSSLADLNVNSKPLINMLTILADENIEYAPVIVKVVEHHIAKVHPDIKLPILYLVDSIVKNVKKTYIPLFSQCIVNMFCGVFEQVNEKIRERMYTLRQTWNEVFTAQKLYTLDVKVNCIDRNWPITAKVVAKSPSIHVNPDFLKKNEVEKTLHVKTRELLELEKRKLELELEATKKLLQEQEKQLSKRTETLKAEVEQANIRHMGINMVQPPGQQHPLARNVNAPPNFRNPALRPPAPIKNTPSQQVHPIGSAPHPIKPKVHPVSAALINSARRRDPRLARQQQQAQQPDSSQDKPTIVIPPDTTKLNPPSQGTSKSQTLIPSPTNNHSKNMPTASSAFKTSKPTDFSRMSKRRDNERPKNERPRERSSKSRSEEEHSDSGSTNKNKNVPISNRNKREEKRTRSESKSPIRPRSLSSRSSSHQRNSSSSRDKDKRGTSNNKVTTSSEKRKTSSRSNDLKFPSTFHKIEEESDVGSTKNKKVSNSQISPSKKHRDSKSRSNSTKPPRSLSNRKHKSHSPSPPGTKDVDLRIVHPDKRARLMPPTQITRDVNKLPESPALKPPPPPTLVTLPTNTNADDKSLPEMISTKDPVIAEPKPIPINISAKTLDQNLEPIHSVKDVDLRQFQRNAIRDHQPASSATSTIVQSIHKLEKSTELPTDNISESSEKSLKTQLMEEHAIEDCNDRKNDIPNGKPNTEKKRPPSHDPTMSSEPIAKKNKQEKVDSLFGTEDVDLRTVLPTVIINQPIRIMTPPPPPVISTEKENWAKVKGTSSTPKVSPGKSSLEDVRAKLAKAAKFSKLEKSQKEMLKLKMSELQDETASQECNDSKIRTMISQGQELLENRSINEEQYQNLVKTVMQINETNKLNAARRLESLNSIETPMETDSLEAERVVRETFHKHRIPKDQPPANIDLASVNSIDSSTPADNISIDSTLSIGPPKQQTGEKDKRIKVSKWSTAPPVLMNTPAPGAMFFSQLPPPQRHRMGMPHQMQNNRAQFNNRFPIPNPWQNPVGIFNGPIQQTPQTANNLPLPSPVQAPPPVSQTCNSVDNPQAHIVRTINIDGRKREIRFYDNVAIVFMDWDQPREIGFQSGTRKVTIDNKESVELSFNEGHKEVTIDGVVHRLRFGFPSRELYIDEDWYEIYFGGRAISVQFHGNIHLIQAEGPPPQVHIGTLRRDLVAGKINMIIDARNIIPIFLDADPQYFTLDGTKHVIEFADNLKTVIIDNEPLQVEYGGLPKSIFLGGRKCFVRFGALPSEIILGQHVIKGMKYLNTQPPPIIDRPRTPPVPSKNVVNEEQEKFVQAEPLPVVIPPPPTTASPPPTSTTATPALPSAIPGIAPVLPNVNIDELFQKLISTGIINKLAGSNDTSSENKVEKEESGESKPAKEPEPIKPIDLACPETIKTRQASIINLLFCGMQCSSCGVRFPPEQTIKYSQHLDWHFRQNRRERDTSRKTNSRKWYYEVSDWLQYEEIEDLDDREKNFFETQQIDVETMDENSNQRQNSPALSCPAEVTDVNRACDVCREKFEQFYNEELEEWHLRAAIRIEDKIYHPVCYEDYKASLANPTEAKSSKQDKEPKEASITIDDDNGVDVAVVKTEKAEVNPEIETAIIPDDDDDDVIMVPAEEPSITEIDDDDEYVPLVVTNDDHNKEVAEVTPEEDCNKAHEPEPDVEIQEPNIPFTDLDSYVEKPSSTDEASQSSFGNVKIKVEPKDDDEEDDGFEDVGVVLILEEEISLQSSDENTATRTISSTVSTPTPSPSVIEISGESSQLAPATSTSADAPKNLATDEVVEITNSMDGNLEPHDNPPTASTTVVGVNKIKINMTKNIVASNNSSSTTTTITKSNSINQTEVKSTGAAGGNNASNISTIPVLCSGATTISTLQPIIPSIDYDENVPLFSDHSPFSAIPSLCNPVTSSNSNSTINTNVIQVITSHTTTGPNTKENFSNSIPVIGTNSVTPREAITPPLSTVTSLPLSPLPEEEDEPAFTLKSELQNVQLKKMKKIECGLEASGLCSIM